MIKDNEIDYVELPAKNVNDLAKSKAFFNTVFGWSYKDWGDDYADTHDSGVTSGISASEPTGAPLPVIRVTDIQVAYDGVTKAGGVITKEIFKFPGGKRFHFKEPAGNELAVWTETKETH